MAKQRGGNRPVFISIIVFVLVAGIVVGVLFATGVLGKKSSGGSSRPIIPATPGSNNDIPVNIDEEIRIVSVSQLPSRTANVVRFLTHFHYVPNTLNNVTAIIAVSVPHIGTKTLTANGINMSKIGGLVYDVNFDFDLSSLPDLTPSGWIKKYDATMIVKTDSGLTSLPFSFNFNY